MRRMLLAAALVFALVAAATPSAAAAPGAYDVLAGTERWAAAQLGFEPAGCVLEAGQPSYGLHSAEVIRTPASCVVWVRPFIRRGLERVARGRPADDGMALALFVALHEVLHRPWSGGPVEEGVTNAVAIDLFPAFTRAVIGRPLPMMFLPGYERETANVVAASRYATGSPHGRTRAARLWRRALLLADEPTRTAMLAAADAARAAARA